MNPARRLLLWLALLPVAFVLGGLASSREPAVLAALVLTYLISRSDPPRALALSLVVLPFAGRFPGFYNPLWAVVLTLLLREIMGAMERRPGPGPCPPALAWGAAFLLVALASLIPQVIPAVLADPDPVRLLLQEVPRASARDPAYGIASVLELLQGLALAWMVSSWARDPGTRDRMTLALILGHTVALVLGLLDRAGAVDLTRLRPLSRMILDSEYPDRIHSVFWHPSWYAQYLVLAIPCVLARFRLSGPRGRRILGPVMALSLIALALTFQRGGWIALLAGLALAAVATGSPERVRIGHGTGAVMVLAALALAGFLAISSSPLSRRIQEIPRNLSGRAFHWRAALEMIRDRPLLGHGYNTFAWIYPRYRPAGHPERVSQWSSAHNGYLQILAGCGIPGLLCFLVMVKAMLGAVIGSRSTLDETSRITLRGCLGGLLGYLVYGLVQELFYVHALGLLFWTHCGLTLALTAPRPPGRVEEPPQHE